MHPLPALGEAWLNLDDRTRARAIWQRYLALARNAAMLQVISPIDRLTPGQTADSVRRRLAEITPAGQIDERPSRRSGSAKSGEYWS